MSQILVIDDDPTVRLVLKRALEGQGYSVALASQGEEGIAQAKKLHPALIICDWMMPIMDGLEVCRQVKANPTLSTTFFILLTARGAVEDRVKGLDTGADDFLSKPIEMNELKARVRAGLRLHQLSQDLQIQKQLLEAELSEAADYMRSLLPSSVSGDITIDAEFIPSRQLGGDCFDYYWLDPDYLMIYLLDVSGHGLGAALPSVSVLNLLRSQSLPNVNFYRPDAVLKALNEAFQMNNQNEKYFTLWYGVYSREKRLLTYASAGHPPAVLISRSTTATDIKYLKTPNLPIGMLSDVSFKSDRCEVPEGSLLYIFSDGVYEIQQANGEVWGLDAFVDLLADQETSSGLNKVIHLIQSLNTQDTFNDDLSLLRIDFS